LKRSNATKQNSAGEQFALNGIAHARLERGVSPGPRVFVPALRRDETPFFLWTRMLSPLLKR
jgi:hypothetical protein